MILFKKSTTYVLTTMSTFLVFYLLNKYIIKPDKMNKSTQTVSNDYEKLGQFLVATVPDESIVWDYLANLEQ